ncbi:unknown protein [Desulfotalea psychrophila LSv54]|uniref:Uncharacterized protein n=1 Tax=Desulfotalea psychrophila (strain LSv54 / DSM 12343) TaxID=177439 RepID=Q6ART3_DESPS|nr:unknown protein [Desulfotalea psychrophila LSv54]
MFLMEEEMGAWSGRTFLTFAGVYCLLPRCFRCFACGKRFSLIGNPVEFRNGPAAVTGDNFCIMSLNVCLGRRRRRMIQKSEDLPATSFGMLRGQE